MTDHDTCAHCHQPLDGSFLGHPRCGERLHPGCIAAHMSSCVSSVQGSETTRTGAFAVLARREGPTCKSCDEIFEPEGLESECPRCRSHHAHGARRKRRRGWLSWLAA